ncbi:MAG: hypothetical protein A7316_02615 [Candidatus Altiarchaeales archaeon WOR_SM1_86-2]|nr:MAG: hypothetical protein A7316_02615 [Candidatus Altiarchaeales archaeon WOR_SM1_86-2]ODS39433.1 MAG: hypothetical protein A7315_11065 [Candidatus Altiarchaeales archaeon WOR_SM1_79]
MKINGIQFLLNASWMTAAIFVPLLAKEFGASTAEVGIIVMVYGLTYFLASHIFGRASDIYGRRVIIISGLFLSMLAFFIQIFAYDVLSLIVVRGLAGFALGIVPAALITYAYERKKPLGEFSSYGSLGWAFGNLITIIAAYKNIIIAGSLLFGFFGVFMAEDTSFYKLLFLIASFLLLIAFLLSFKLQKSKETRVNVPFFPAKLIKKNLSVYLSFFIRNLGAWAVWAIFPIYLSLMGASLFIIGVVYIVNSGAQVIIMRVIDKHVERLGCEKFIAIGLSLSVVVFVLYGLIGQYDIGYHMFFPVQLLLAASYSCLYVGSLVSLTSKNIERATSIGGLNAVMGLSSVAGPLLGGAIAELLGYSSLMYAAAFLGMIGLLSNYILRRK